METYKLKIRDRYILPIALGKKKHEYRLATEERKNIKIGDVLLLVSNLDKNVFVKAYVTKIENYSNWQDALCKYWKDDFYGVFNSFDDVLRECAKFYAPGEVEKSGIEVLEISPLKVELRNAKMLLDTNIVVHRESSNNIAYEVIQLYKLLDELNSTKIVHKCIVDEISKYKDKNVRANMLSKLGAYVFVDSNDTEDSVFSTVISKYGQDENSIVDNKLLYLAYKGTVDFFITNDKGILNKAKELYLDDVVVSANEFLNLVEKNYPSLINYPVLSVKLAKIGTLQINNSFFDSLREDYNGIEFNRWLSRKANENAYIFKGQQGLEGFLYLKIENQSENYADIEPCFSPKKRLKVGTFKIKSTGLRIGERFLKIIFDYALRSKVDEIYVTLFENKRPEVIALMNLMAKWGFTKHGYKKSNGELVLVKKMGIYFEEKDPKFNYPNLKPRRKFGILPIEAQYHTDLFPDLFLKNENMNLFAEKPCGYAVEKIYVCKLHNIPLSPGDIMVVYRMAERSPAYYHSVATGYCVLEKIERPNSFDEYLDCVTNRSVFCKEELRDFYFEKGFRTVLKILYIKPLEKKVIYGDLLYNKIINEEDGPRLTTTLTEEQFNQLQILGGSDISQ